MRTRLSPAVCGALSIPLLLAGGALRADQAPAPSTVHAAYVLLAESPGGSIVAFARVIVDSGQSASLRALRQAGPWAAPGAEKASGSHPADPSALSKGAALESRR